MEMEKFMGMQLVLMCLRGYFKLKLNYKISRILKLILRKNQF
jgi:hypothetical protein